MKKTKTLKVRVKDKHVKLLNSMARSVNFVWNCINELSIRSIKERGKFLSAYDIHPYIKGAGKELGLHSQSLQCITAEYVTRRKQFKKAGLNWRKSNGVRRPLGWIPVNTVQAKWKNDQVFHNGHYFSVWDSFGLSGYKFRSASCKETATDSNGKGVTGREYRALEAKPGIAQRAKNMERVKAIHAKIKNRRQDALHQYSRKLVDENAAIFVGNVSSLAMTRTRKAKSALDAGCWMLDAGCWMLDAGCWMGNA